MDPVSLALSLLSGGSSPVETVRSYVPTESEVEMRRRYYANQDAIDGGRGGYTAGELQRLQAQGSGQLASQTQQALATLARGANPGGETGTRQQAQTDIYKAALNAGQQMQSSIRDADLAKAEQLRKENDAILQQLLAAQLARRGQSVQMAQVNQPPDAVRSDLYSKFYTQGAGQRTEDASAVTSATDQLVQ